MLVNLGSESLFSRIRGEATLDPANTICDRAWHSELFTEIVRSHPSVS